MKKLVTAVILITCMLTNHNTMAQTGSNTTTKYRKVPAGYLMVLTQGDSIMAELEKLAVNQNLPAANFTGMGFVNIQFGYFDFTEKKYHPKNFDNVELASMHGTIAWQKGKVSIHAHGVVGDKDFNARAGHILAATVSTGSVEILITTHDKKLERIKDEELGANVLTLD